MLRIRQELVQGSLGYISKLRGFQRRIVLFIQLIQIRVSIVICGGFPLSCSIVSGNSALYTQGSAQRYCSR